MANSTVYPDLPPLPDYALHPLPPLVSWLPDKYLTLALPVIAYWGVSMFFHVIDVYDLFPQYRLHTPVEVLKRNHVTRWEVFRDVIIQQIIQTIFGIGLAMIDEDATYGKEDYDVARWAQKIRLAQRAVPPVLSIVGVNTDAFATKLAASYPTVSGVLAGGRYPWLDQLVSIEGQRTLVPAFATWELNLAKFIYWMGVPALQFLIGILIVDTWQYCLHRAMHQNRWLYVKFHSRHHKLYVPYAYGALYNHPFEGFLLDTLGTGLAYLIAGMTIRQSMVFFTGSTIKTVDDHCGYALPFDPLQRITSNNAAYHDIHHQSWGIKSNFSQPFFTFWDRLCGTVWKGGDVSARYEKSRRQAQQKLQLDNTTEAITPTPEVIDVDPTAGPVQPSNQTPLSVRRSTRKKTSSISQQSGNLKGFRTKVNESLHGKGGNVLGVESSH